MAARFSNEEGILSCINDGIVTAECVKRPERMSFEVKNDKGVSVKKVHLVPIVNHFEQNYTNFKLIPFYKYTEAQAEKHMQRESSANFSLDWIATQIHYLYDSTGFIKEDLS